MLMVRSRWCPRGFLSTLVALVGVCAVSCGGGGGDGSGTNPDTESPQLQSGPEVSVVDSASVTITWSTNEPASSWVRLGVRSVNERRVGESRLASQHTVKVDGLSPGIEYVYQVESTDEAANPPCLSDINRFTCEHTSTSWCTTGWSEFEGGEWSAAQTAFEGALRIKPAMAQAHLGLGWTYLRTSRLVDATEELMLIAGDHPATARHASAGLAFAYIIQGNPADAIEAAGKVLAADASYVFPYDTEINSSDLLVVIAEGSIRLGDLARAQETFDRLDPGNGLKPNRPESWIVDGRSYSSYLDALLAELERVARLFEGVSPS